MTKQRLKILSKSEINELYNIPLFNSNEKEKYFSLDKKEYEAMSKCGSLASKLHFTLQLGYFKAASQFFNCAFDTVTKDVDFVLKKYFENAKLHVNTISKQARHTNQASIAKILNYQTEKSIIQEKLQKMLEIKTRLSNNPIYLFHEILCHCEQNKLMLLGYSSIQDLIGSVRYGQN